MIVCNFDKILLYYIDYQYNKKCLIYYKKYSCIINDSVVTLHGIIK
ncbi:hypothetical protein SAMN05216261_2925 [Algibacter luteus]|uniref:Uncharacterized protein n=1 Tax=Algibacter luteus TaxID=1178825 RepID=A0A1M6GWJ9_9FLAO|nr:hypothetical protein SAMN05216261_2925 [Algibacter luteus]